MPEVLRHHRLVLDPVAVQCKPVKREPDSLNPAAVQCKPVQREPDSLDVVAVQCEPVKRELEPAHDAGASAVPAKAVKIEAQEREVCQARPSGREVSKSLLRNLPFRPLSACSLDIERASIIFGIWASEHHWAALVVNKGQGVVFDGKADKDCFNQAAAFMQHMREAGHLVTRQLLAGRCPPQTDNWSCGHRVIVCILADVAGTGQVPQALDESALSQAHVQALLEDSSQATGDNQQQQTKRKAERVQASEGHAAESSSPNAADTPCTPKRTRPSDTKS